MNKEDLEIIVAIEQRVFPFPWSMSDFQKCLDDNHYCYTYTEDREIIAYGILYLKQAEGHLVNLCVEPEYQRQGIGSLLLSHLLTLARQDSIISIILEVRPSNFSALCLYQKFGFKEIGIQKDYYFKEKGFENAVVMALNLI